MWKGFMQQRVKGKAHLLPPTDVASRVRLPPHEFMDRRNDVHELPFGDAAVSVGVVHLEGELQPVLVGALEQLGQAYQEVLQIPISKSENKPVMILGTSKE